MGYEGLEVEGKATWEVIIVLQERDGRGMD